MEWVGAGGIADPTGGAPEGSRLARKEPFGSSGKESYSKAVEALRGRLNPGDMAMAAQDFRHTSQADGESVSDFVRHLE